MLKILPPILILICVVVLLFPALPGGRALLPAGDLAYMSPWNSVLEPAGLQWNPLMWDALAQFYPWRALYNEALHDGELPLWNPRQLCGAPLYANVQSAVFYPLNLIFYVMDPARAFGFSALLHLFLAGLFTFLLARALGASPVGATVSGLTYALCAFNVTWLELPTFVNVATWLPLILLLIRLALTRASNYLCVAAGAAVGMALLAGHFQIAFYTLFAAFAWGIWTAFELRRSGSRRLVRSLARLASIAVFGFGLAAIQLLPSFELAVLSHRTEPATLAGYSRYAASGLPGMNLITAFVPDFFGNPSKNSPFWGMGNYAEYAMYVGILPLILAVTAMAFDRRGRHKLFFAILAAFSILIALGTPLNAIFYYGVPGFNATGSPARILLLYCLSMSILAGFGATAFTGKWPGRFPNLLAGRMSMTLFVLGVTGFAFLAAGLYTSLALTQIPGMTSEQTYSGLYGVFIAVGLFFVAAAILVWRAAGMIRPSLTAGLIILATVSDLLLFGYNYNVVSPASAVYPPTHGISFLQEFTDRDRIMPINSRWSLVNIPPAILPPNSATVYALYDMQGYDSLFPGAYKRFAAKLQGQDPSPIQNGNMVLFRSYSRRAARYAKYVVSSAAIPDPALQLVYEDEFFVYENPNALPRAEVFRLDPRDPPPTFRWTHDLLNQVELKVMSQKGARLVLRDTLYPGWKAYVEEKPVPIQPYEGIFRSVVVSPGSAPVMFKFEPSSLRVGMYISLLFLAACAACVTLRVAGTYGRRGP
ncbi:MAG: YfhO family protein [Armatimonadota bacterium]|nr:YfhO family protein [Armatimonadota bacterium]